MAHAKLDQAQVRCEPPGGALLCVDAVFGTGIQLLLRLRENGMTQTFKLGDRVRIKGANSPATFVIVECPVAGAHPLAPSTQVVRMADIAKPERDFYRYGNHRLELAPDQA